jgi:phage-related protein
MGWIEPEGRQGLSPFSSTRYWRCALRRPNRRRAPDAKVLKGFGGASVLEIVSLDKSGTYRAVYTVKFEDAVYMLHAFQKKSKKGIESPKEDIEVVRRRLTEVERVHKGTNR